jgi:transcriptional regulator with XRE-family HTH domain
MTIKNQVLKDLESSAKEKNISIKELMKEISKDQEICLRTFSRLSEKNSAQPSNDTLEKIYSYLYSTDSLVDLILKVPENIANSLKTEYLFYDKNRAIRANQEILNLSKDDTFNSVYFMTSGDYGTDLKSIREEFGKRGLQVVDKLVMLGLVTINNNERLVRKNTIFSTSEIRINQMKTLTNLYDPSKNTTPGKNYAGIFMGNVTNEEFDEIYLDLRDCLNRIGKKIADSIPTQDNCKQIALGGVLEEIGTSGNGGLLC